MSALEDRRQAAREAYFDDGEDAAIETATRVRITPEITSVTGLPEVAARAVLIAAFRAAGFEVEE